MAIYIGNAENEVMKVCGAASIGPKGDKGDKGDTGPAGTTDYNNLINKPTIPSLTGYATEQWVEGKGYLTENAVETVNGETPDETGNIDIDASDIALETTSTLSSTNVQSAIDELDEKVNAKQDALTAGANITIENNVISAVGGSGVQEVFFAVYGSTSLADIITAHQSGKEVICINGNKHYRLQSITGGVALFSSFESPTDYRLSVRADGGWGSASVTMLKADTIPQATDTALGGIKAAARNASTDTQEVKIDTASGKLYVPDAATKEYVDTAIGDAIGGAY